MSKIQNVKEYFLNLFFKYSKILLILNIIVLLFLIAIPPIYYALVCIVSLFIWGVLNQTNIISYCTCDLKKYKETSLIKRCETIEDITDLKSSIEIIDRELIKNILLYYLNYKKVKIEKGLINEIVEYEKFNNKIEEAKAILENISDIKLKNKLQKKLDLNVKIYIEDL